MFFFKDHYFWPTKLTEGDIIELDYTMEQSQEHQSGKPDRALEATATSLGIAPENRNHPVVRQFVGFVNQVQDLQLGLTSAVSQSPATKEALEAGLPPAPP